ncbi:uncharacterized protein LOC124168207 [Ischnura elegans]|uniref:uncharacterized protein LOC124168207 n=1 Tax=Ischnura elegans TaxID=197161 RepID=UPI001ED8B5CE|nr:uncharacterized protein LOC124168207 [Ischnura elegans]
MAAGGAALVGCCACCRKTPKGFQEFTDSGSSHSLSTGGGCINPGASSSSPGNEFTIFPPAAAAPPTGPGGGGGPVSFEPLPDIRPRPAPSAAASPDSISAASRRRPSQKKPAAFNNAVSHGLSAQDWFDDPHANFPRSQLKYLCEFGKGWFGRVVEGEALGLSNGMNGISPPTRVIVKILHGDATPTDQMYFLHEVRYLRDLSPHPNILQLKGRCLETDPFLIILEACPTGDLKTFLLQNLATSEALSMQGVILRMACNVAAGLQHMHERGFVHTDLAARNCLVASDLTVKIGDYGTSIDNFKEDYYCADDVALPIRWCAPETLHCTDTTIETKEVTTAANIWSFGVILWELCEFGRLPYSELNDEEVIIKVLSEKSLHLGPPSRPCLQANNLYHLMRMCWSSNHKRPGVAQVVAVLNNLSIHPEGIPSQSFEDFERLWAMTKPNGVVAVVETIVHEPPPEMILQKDEEEGGDEGERRGELEPVQRNQSPSPHPSLHGEPISPVMKHKSPSLQNLHGSLEDLVESSCPEEEDVSKDSGPVVCELDVASCAIPLEDRTEASWLHDSEPQGCVATEDDDDAQFVRKISEAIRDLDDVLALEKTSSSSGSGTSPEEHSPTKKRFLCLSHEKIDENGVLDFRLKGGEVSLEDAQVPVVDGSTKEPSSVQQMDSLQWEEASVSSSEREPRKRSVNDDSSDECRAVDQVGSIVIGEDWMRGVVVDSRGVEEGGMKPKTAMEEEEEEAWRQRVERGEFTAKVREKSRSVQDLMVLTHIEDSSEGSDSEGGGSNTGSSPPPGPLLPSSVHPPSFGSVGDLRRAVLGDEFRHTLERLCAANKKAPLDRPNSPHSADVSNMSEELEENKSHLEKDKEENTAVSSQDNLSGGETPLSPGKPISKVSSGIASEEMLGLTEDVGDRKDTAEAQFLPERISNQFVADSCKKLDSLITSTPIGSALRNSSANEESFLFNLPLSTPLDCSMIRSDTPSSSVSSVDPTFPECDPSPSKTVNIKSSCGVMPEIIERATCDLKVPNVSNETLIGTASDSPPPKTWSENVIGNTKSSKEKLEFESENNALTTLVGIVPDSTHSKNSHEILVSSSSVESIVSVSPLSKLAMNCLSSIHSKPFGSENRDSIFLDLSCNHPKNHGDVSPLADSKSDGKGSDQKLENSPQESPLSEAPGELGDQSPLHGLSHGISGSQSTVECRSPLALSPVTVGIEDISSPTSTTVLSVSNQDIIMSVGNSPCEEKFKSDGVTKEINSDFLFSVDASVENMDAVIKPDLLLDTEKVNKSLPFSGNKVPSDLIGHSNMNFQDNVVEALISNIESEKNLGSWLKPDTVGKGMENSHILLDLVQITSKKLQKSSNASDILSEINEPHKTVPSQDENCEYALYNEVSDGVKELNSIKITKEIFNESQNVGKDNPVSYVPNSEDCDSAGTEDSVFDFSPPAHDSSSVPLKIENSPQEKQTSFKESGRDNDDVSGFSGCDNSRFSPTEIKECVGSEDELELHRAEQRVVEEEDEELALLGAKQWTPDDERSSDSGFRDKGSLSESVEDACERCDLADVETVAEGEEMDGGGGETVAEGLMPCKCSGNNGECTDSNDELYVSAREEEEPTRSPQHGSTSPPPPEKRNEEQEEFWRQQMASLRQAAGDTASLIREASAPIGGDSWREGEGWDEEDDITGSCEELKMSSGCDDIDRGLDEASLAALRSELQEKLGGNNCRFGAEGACEGGMYERACSEERLSEEEDDDGDDVNEERTDITIHYDAYLAQLSPILEERESVGSSEMYSPATKEPPRDSVSDDSATTASVNDMGDNQVFICTPNPQDLPVNPEDVLMVDTLTNQASFVVGNTIEFQENDATSPEFSDSLEDDDNEENDSREKSDKGDKLAGISGENDEQRSSQSPSVRYSVPPSDFWAAIPSIHPWSNGMNSLVTNSSSGASRPSPPRSPLLLPPPPSSAPMPSPEEERAGCVERTGSKKIPMFRDFEDIVALCQNQGDDFSGCNDVASDEGLREDGQRSSEETEVPATATAQNLPFWESESSDGNDSSSSGEFVWKEGERDVPQAVDASALEQVSRVYESLSEFPMAVIEEEDEDDTCNGEGEKDDGASDSSGSIMEFIPSVWNSAAEPSHSSLRSPDRKSDEDVEDQKKNVSFKRQKYHCVYEYPKEEASDSESECQDSPTRRRWDVQQIPPFDYSSFADWELMEGDIPEGIIPSEMEVEPEIPNPSSNHRQFDFYKISSEDYDFGFGVSPDTSEGEFMVSSSSRPFQYCAPDPTFQVGTTQFFPGLGLIANNVPGWVAGRRSSWSKSGEDGGGLELGEGSTVGEGGSSGVTDPAATVDSQQEEDSDAQERPLKGPLVGAVEWLSQQSLPSPTIHSSSSSASLSSCSSPPASPLSPTGLGELRHTRDRLKLDLPHKFNLSEVSQGPKKVVKVTERVEGSNVDSQASEETVDEVKELKVKRRAEEQKGEASLLDAEKEREGITKTAL